MTDLPTFLAPTEQNNEHQRADTPAPVPEQPPAPPPPTTAAPTPLWAGSYAVYDDGAGGVVLVLGTSDGEVHRKHLPATLLRMAEKFGGGPLGALFGRP